MLSPPQIDVQIANHHLMDHIEWDLLSPLTPEAFSIKLCAELGLTGEAVSLVSHAVHEELMKHKKDAIEWGVIGGERDAAPVEVDANAPNANEKRDRSGYGLVKDKTGLGLGLGRAPRDGRGPKTLKSVWRDWAEAEEFRTIFEELTAEEVERREIERERATRCVVRLNVLFRFLTGSHLPLYASTGDLGEKPPNSKLLHARDGDEGCMYSLFSICCDIRTIILVVFEHNKSWHDHSFLSCQMKARTTEL